MATIESGLEGGDAGSAFQCRRDILLFRQMFDDLEVEIIFG